MSIICWRQSRGRRSLGVATLLAALLLTFLLLAGTAYAEDATTETTLAAEPAVEEAPALDYTFTWPTFLITFGLVIGYYIFIFRTSEKEFKGVVKERFGPGRADIGRGS